MSDRMEEFDDHYNRSAETLAAGQNPNINLDTKDDSSDGKEAHFSGEQIVLINHFDSQKDIEEAEEMMDLSPEERAAMQAAIASSQIKDVPDYRMIYEDALSFNRDVAEKYDFYTPMLQMIRNSDFTVDMKKRFLLKAIDESWVEFLEERIQALDKRIRIPSKFIEQQEKVLPIELSRNINNRSIQHLSQHTNYISKVEGDTVTPSKILNVFNEETMMTYENKFVNTLVNRLFTFVAKRYEAAKKSGRDEMVTKLNMEGSFSYGKVNGKISFGVEVSEEPEGEVKLKNTSVTTDVWRRVEKLYEVISSYSSSEFIKAMGRAYIRPPVMRTNAILKNKDLKQCLEIWEFIESYEDAGFSMLAEEAAEEVGEEYIRELAESFTLQYLIFRYQIKNDFAYDKRLAEAISDSPLTPKFVSEIKPLTSKDFDIRESRYEKIVNEYETVHDREITENEQEIVFAIDVALAADEIFDERRLEEERRRKEEEERIAREEAEKAAREAEELAQRIQEEERARQRAEEERQRIEAEKVAAAKRAIEEEKARIEAARIAREEAEERARREKEEKRNAKIRAIEEEVREDAWTYQTPKKMSRKKKKALKRAVETKAEKNMEKVSKTFNYDEYMQYLYREKIEETEREVERKIAERVANIAEEEPDIPVDTSDNLTETTDTPAEERIGQ